MQPGAMWAKVTGQAAGTNRYSWTQIDEGDTAAFDTGLSDSFAATGGSAAEAAPAYEINGRTDVPTGARVRLWPAGDQTFYLFEYTVSGCAGSGTDNHIVRWNGTSAIQDSLVTIDDAGNLTTVGYIVIGSGTGVSNTFSNTSYCLATSYTPHSVLDTTALTIAASANTVPTLFNSTVSQGEQQLRIGGTLSATGLYTFVDDTFAAIGTTLINSTGGVWNGNVGEIWFRGFTFDVSTGLVSSTGVPVLWTGSDGVNYANVAIFSVDGVAANLSSTGLISTDSFLIAQFAAPVSPGVVVTGQSGTLAPGAKAKRGIIYDLGSGSFVGTASNNTFTAANTFHPSSDVVPVTIQGSDGQTADLTDWKDNAGTILAKIDASGNATAVSFTGAGSGLTGLNASNIASGNVPFANNTPIVAAASVVSAYRNFV